MDEVADDGNGDVPAAGFGLDRLDLLVVPAGEGDLAIFDRELVDVCVKFHAARGRRARSA